MLAELFLAKFFFILSWVQIEVEAQIDYTLGEDTVGVDIVGIDETEWIGEWYDSDLLWL